MTQSELLSKLGPLAALAGTWEGEKGTDVAPSADRKSATSKFKEIISLEPFGPADNHEQSLYGLRYALTAWRLGSPDPFHEDRGFFLWDASAKQVMRCFAVPRGIAVLAGGSCEPNAQAFTIRAEVGSPVYGICSNPFLDREFKTVSFEMTVTMGGDGSFSYRQDTVLQVPYSKSLFHHTDTNTLRRQD